MAVEISCLKWLNWLIVMPASHGHLNLGNGRFEGCLGFIDSGIEHIEISYVMTSRPSSLRKKQKKNRHFLNHKNIYFYYIKNKI